MPTDTHDPANAASTSEARLETDLRSLHRRRVLTEALESTHALNDGIDRIRGSAIRSNNDIATLIALLDRPRRPGQLSTITGITPGGTTSLIDRLERLGFVRRQRVADDRRGFLVSITGKGTRMVRKVTAAVGDVVRSAAPTFESWSGPFTALGIELGSFAGSPRDHEETLALVARLANAGEMIGPLYRRAFGESGPTAAYMMHTLLLATEADGTRPTRISDATLLSSASTSDLLERMEELHLVTRVSGRPPDRRVVTVTATKKGRRTLDVIIDGSDPVMQAIAAAVFPLGAEGAEPSEPSE